MFRDKHKISYLLENILSIPVPIPDIDRYQCLTNPHPTREENYPSASTASGYEACVIQTK